LAPESVCCAIANVATIVVSASASISPKLILVFMFILFALPVYSGAWNSHGSGRWNATESKRKGHVEAGPKV